MSPKLLFAVLSLIAFGSTPLAAIAADNVPTDDAERVAALSRQIDQWQAQLKKLDDLVEQLQRVRTEELPQLEKQLRPAAEASVLVKEGEHSVGKPLDPSDVAPDNQSGKIRALEEQMASIQARLQKLDATAELRAQLSDELSRVKAALAQQKPAGAQSRIAMMPIVPPAGRLVVNNLTGLSREITVNGKTYRFEPGYRHVEVPVSEVTTQMGIDKPQRWEKDRWRVTDAGTVMRFDLK